MISIDLFGGLTPPIQLVLIVGSFAMIFLIACNRNAATNLATFLHRLCAIYLLYRAHKQRPIEKDMPISEKDMEHVLDDFNA